VKGRGELENSLRPFCCLVYRRP